MAFSHLAIRHELGELDDSPSDARPGGQDTRCHEEGDYRPDVLDARPAVKENSLIMTRWTGLAIRWIRWTGLAPWEFELPFQGSFTSTFLGYIVPRI